VNLQEFFLQLLKISLSASVVAALVILLRLCFRKAPRGLICALWLLVALRLLIPNLPESKISLLPKSVGSGSAVTEIANMIPEGVEIVKADDPSFLEIVERREAIPKRDSSGQAYVLVSQDNAVSPKTLGESYLPLLTWIWLAGAALLLLYMVWTYFKVWQKSRLSVHQKENVYFCDEPGTPFVFGLFRPRIYVPSNLSDEALACVLGHERAHIARRDPLWKLFGFLLLCLHWFNPILWISYMLLCRDIEKACDERAIRKQSASYRKAYSFALLELSTPKHWISACPVAFGEIGVKERVKATLRYKNPGYWIVAAMMIISLIAAGCALTNPEGTGTGSIDRFQLAAREGDAAGDGWIISFTYEECRGKDIPIDQHYSYSYEINNIRYWDDNPTRIFSSPSYQTSIHSPWPWQDGGFSENTEGLERDLALIGELLKDGTPPEDLLALDPASLSFEVLDKSQFFRLMRKALTATPREPERQRSFDGPFYGCEYFREKDFEKGYAFRFALLECWGFMDDAFIDIAYGSPDNFVLLSDLVEQGTATPEQQEAYALIRQISESLKGREFEPNYGAESYKNTLIGEIDFGRLYKMMNYLMDEIWPDAYYLPSLV